jgi:hypothetical protein
VDQSGPSQALAPGEKGTVKFTFRNTGNATLYRAGANPTDCRASNQIDRVSSWIDASGTDVVLGKDGPQGVPIDQAKVAPGEQFTCTIPIRAPEKAGTYKEYFAPVTEGKAWMFNNGHDDVWFPLTSAS